MSDDVALLQRRPPAGTRAPSDALLRTAVAMLAKIRDELRGLRADLRRRDSAVPLLAALEAFFGPGRFTVRGLLEAAEVDAGLASALAAAIDMNASEHSRATALGSLLARQAGVEVVARRGGCAVYRVACTPEAT